MRGRYHISRSVQIGEGGMMIYSDDKLAVGQRVVLSFKLPGRIPSVVMGTVKYVMTEKVSSRESYGLEFTNLNFEVKREIRNYVAMQTDQAGAI